MKIKRISLENYKSLKKITIENLGDIVTFIGPNMAGKSSLFDALKFLRECSQTQLKDVIAGRGGYKNVVWRQDGSQIIKFEITIIIDEAIRKKLLSPYSDSKNEAYKENFYKSCFLKELYYTLFLQFDVESQRYEEKLETADVGSSDAKVIIITKNLNVQKGMYTTAINAFHEKLGSVFKCNPFGSNFQQSSESNRDSIKLMFANDDYRPRLLEHKIIKEFCDFTKRWYSLNPHIKPQDSYSSTPETELDQEAKNLCGVLHTLASSYPDILDKILSELQGIIDSVERLYSPLDGSTTTIGMRESGLAVGITYNLNNFSAGLKNVLAIITLLNTVENDALVMLEEPESHLHPQAIKKLMKIIMKHIKHKQILFATHSATALMGFNLNHIFLVQRDENNNTLIDPVTSDNVPSIIKALGIQPSDFLDHNLIVFVEGDYDVEIYKAFAKKQSLESVDSIYISTRGWKNMDYHTNASVLEKRNVCPKIIAIFDGDTEQNKHEKNRMLHRMRVPEENIITLMKKEIECYLLDADAWFAAFPQLKISVEELGAYFKQINDSDKPRKHMDKIMVDLGIGSYTREKAVLIVEKMEIIPGEIEQILERIQVLKDN
jgi:predicted ATPase